MVTRPLRRDRESKRRQAIAAGVVVAASGTQMREA